MRKIRGLAIFCTLVFLVFLSGVPVYGGNAEVFKFRFRIGEPLYYRMIMDMDIGMDMKVSGQTVKTDMIIKMNWTIKLTPQSIKGDLALLNMETANLEADWNIGTPEGKVEITLRGDHVVGTRGGVTIIDTKKGIGTNMAKELTGEIEPLKRSGQLELFSTGRHGKVLGDPKFVKFWTESLEGQLGFFGLFFSKEPVAVGDSFHEYLILKKIGKLMLEEPGLQCKVLVSRQADKNVNGRTVSSFKISAPFSQKNLAGYVSVGAQKMRVDIREFKRDAVGDALFDNKKGVLLDSHLDIDAFASMKIASGVQSLLMDMDMKITIDLRKVEK